jgi:4-amino-4-deoxy-L-arabinose transferase-like glycosyltransferase
MPTNHNIGPVRWMLKSISGWMIVETAAFAVMSLILRAPITQLWQPYILLLVPGIVASALLYKAAKLQNQPRSFSIWLSLIVLATLVLCLPIFCLYGVRLGIMSQAFSRIFFWFGMLGAAIVSLEVYYLTYRRLNSKKVQRAPG